MENSLPQANNMTLAPPGGHAPSQKQVKCKDCALRKSDTFRAFTPKELEFVQSLKRGELAAEAGTTIFLEGQNSAHLYTILSGWVFRYKTMPDGRRQILNFGLPGELLGLQTYVFKELDHSVEALTDVVLCVFPREKIWSIFENYPELSFDLTWISARSENLLDNNLLSVGRMTAIERVAHAILQIFDRLDQLEMNTGNVAEIPFTQEQLSDALGLSHVHTNKMIKELADLGHIDWQSGKLKVSDREALIKLSGYETPVDTPRPFI